jgi:AraC family transcriptional regulator
MENMDIFHTLSEQITVRIRGSHEELHDGSWSETKQHGDYDLWLVLSGEVRIMVEGETYTAYPGDAVFFYPHQPYRASTTDAGCSFIFTHFDFDLGERPAILNAYPLAGIVPGRLIAEETELLRQAYPAFKARGPLSAMRLRGALFMLLSAIMLAYADGRYIGSFQRPRTSGPPADLALLQPVFHYIDGHLNRSLRICELAELAGMSDKYFIAYFKRALGLTPGQYIYHLRMHKARELLYKRSFSVKEIADQLGYPDAYSFSKAFKKFYAIPPSRFI